MSDETEIHEIVDEIEQLLSHDYYSGEVTEINHYGGGEDPDYVLKLAGEFAALHLPLVAVREHSNWTVAYLVLDSVNAEAQLGLDYIGDPEGEMFTGELLGP